MESQAKDLLLDLPAPPKEIPGNQPIRTPTVKKGTNSKRSN